MFSGNLFGEVLEAGLVIYVIDKATGKRKRVVVKNQAEKKRLLAQNKKLKAELAKKKPTKKKK